MKKNRKTRKEKLRRDLKKIAPILEVETQNQEVQHTHVTHTLAGISIPTVSPTNPAVNRAKYAYVIHDVRNTLTILAIIMFANVTLYFLIQQGIITIAW